MLATRLLCMLPARVRVQGFGLSEMWRAPAAIMIRDVSPPNLGSTGSAVHLCVRNLIGGLGPLGAPLLGFGVMRQARTRLLGSCSCRCIDQAAGGLKVCLRMDLLCCRSQALVPVHYAEAYAARQSSCQSAFVWKNA